jgi:hypothetical protein
MISSKVNLNLNLIFTILDLTKEDKRDNKIFSSLKHKLSKVIKTEKEFEDFKARYNNIVEKHLIEKIVERKRKTAYYTIVENKADTNYKLEDINSPLNKHKKQYSVTPHDHIHPQHLLKDPEKANAEKWKYLAFYDIVIDQHLRKIRPDAIDDQVFKYVKPNHKPLSYTENHLIDNMYYDFLYTLDNEFYLKFKEEIRKIRDLEQERNHEQDDPVNIKYFNILFYRIDQLENYGKTNISSLMLQTE